MLRRSSTCRLVLFYNSAKFCILFLKFLICSNSYFIQKCAVGLDCYDVRVATFQHLRSPFALVWGKEFEVDGHEIFRDSLAQIPNTVFSVKTKTFFSFNLQINVI